ncbi:MAG: TonB-dependent receptor [Candidatus Marinimicrobia bacterium]|nr:TonB-dependent receptor [Candidatus Neomarinimicrobiota bacterium]
MILKTLSTVIMLFAFPLVSNGQSFIDVTGKVVNSNTGEPLQGANILIEKTSFGGASDKNGLFSIRNLPLGNYTISVSVIGYEIEKQLIQAESKDIIILFSLTSRTLEGENVVISGSRAVTGKTPIAFSNIDSRTLSEKYSSQEVPLLLDEVPSLYSYSYTGNGMGYSEIKIRGFDATRIAVTVNNVPLNDPEDHVTYFYDIADFSGNIQDIQVQRGVGNSLYGTAAIGGSVNILTKGAGTEPGMKLSGTWGSYNTRRLNFSYGTGIINNTYSTYGRFSKLETDGYRNDSGVDSWSYFLSGTRYDRDMTTTFNVFGGPLVAKFAWFGISKDKLEDEDERRTNYYSPSESNGFFDEQKDDFLQSHYQVLNDWKVSENVRLENTLFHVKGDGFFLDYKFNTKPDEYNLVLVDSSRSDLLRKQIVDKWQWGWLPRLTIFRENWSLTIGGELSVFGAKHWGEVTWVKENNLTPPNNKYYGYQTDKSSATIYTHVVYGLSEKTDLMFDLQYQRLNSNFDQEIIGGFKNDYEYRLNYNFLAPRMGINQQVNENISAFANFSIAKREPKDSDVYDANDFDTTPRFGANSDNTLNFDDPLIGEETLYDYELGSMLRNSSGYVKLNLFWMDFRDEIVQTGLRDDIGLPIYYNAEKSVHRGIEVDAFASNSRGFYISGNLSLNDNYFVAYNEVVEYVYDESGNLIPFFDRSDNQIGGFPGYLAGLKAGYRNKAFSSFIGTRFVGRQYLDNSETEALSIDGYNVSSLFMSYDLTEGVKMPLHLQLNVDNIFSTKYETSGYVYYYEGFIPEYIPAAVRNTSITVTVKF